MSLSNPNQPRLLSFALDDSPVLGRRVSLSLTNGFGVLVGRNGAGKSAIIEGLEAISLSATGRTNQRNLPKDSDSIPKKLDIEILTPTGRQLQYHYELITTTISADDPDIDDSTNDRSEESQFSWNDYCQYIDGQKEVLWTTNTGVTTFNQEDDPIILGRISSLVLERLYLPKNLQQIKSTNEMQWVYAVLKGIRILGKVPVRRTSRRRPSQIRVFHKRTIIGVDDIIDRLTHKIIRLDLEELDELKAVCQRIGLGNEITIQKFVLSGTSGEKLESEDEEHFISVLLDGVNIGLLSDGTLRILSILLEIIPSSSSTTTIIEEPETQIHPGLLSKLLNEIESYTFGENLVISTHSPQVVSWTSPDKINLVYRNHGQIFVRKLGKNEIQRVVEYLSEDGNLGEWIYGGIIDE